MFPEGRALEFLIAGVVALIVVGPKDLPVLLRKLGQFMAKVRSMAAEFRASFDEMARQSELDELRKEVEAMRSGQYADIAARAGAPEMAQTFDELSQGLTDVGVQLHPPMSYQYTGQENETAAQAAMAPKAKKTRRVAAKPTPAKTKTPAKKAPAKAAAAKTAPAKAVAKPKAAVKPAAGDAKTKAPAPRPRARKTAGTVT
jgi:sec-independent protein translocase protein TatB